jgi:hypothetical protein
MSSSVARQIDSTSTAAGGWIELARISIRY